MAKRGRPPGSKNKLTIWKQQLEDAAPALMQKAIQDALAGDPMMMKFLLSRVVPPLAVAEVKPEQASAEDIAKSLADLGIDFSNKS